MEVQNIVDHWMAQQREAGLRPKEACAKMTDDLGQPIGYNRLSEWRLRRRPLPWHVHRYMLECLAPEIVADLDRCPSDEKAARLLALVSRPEENINDEQA